MKHERAGTAIAMVLATMAVASLLIASQAGMILVRQRAARQTLAKAQAQWLAESALDRARLLDVQSGEPALTWRPDVSPARLPVQAATAKLEDQQNGGVSLVVSALVGDPASPTAARHILREPRSKEPEP